MVIVTSGMKGHHKGAFIGVPGVFFVCALFLCMMPLRALASVMVFDMLAVKGEKVMLRAETRGKFFRKGGQLVELFVDGESIGKNLSGGDGVVYKAYTPLETGLFQIEARSDGEEGTGWLLCLQKGSGIVFIEVEGGLLEAMSPMEKREGSVKAVEKIRKTHPVVFLQTSFLGVKAVKAWLKEYEFAKLPVLPWKEGRVFDEITAAGLKIKAVIGGAEVIESAEEYDGLLFSFEEAEGAERAKDWEEVIKKLNTRPASHQHDTILEN
jgi:hypothetical protein